MSADARVKQEDGREEEEEEDLFGQDDDEEEQEKAQPTAVVKEEDRNEDANEEEEDLFGQDDDDAEEEKSVKQEEVIEPATSVDEEKEKPVVEEKKDPEPSNLGFELDTTPSDVPVSSPVPRKPKAPSSPKSPKLPPSAPLLSDPSPKAGTSPRSKSNNPKAAKFGLPSNVIIPDSVDASLLSGRIVDTLKVLPSNLCNDALQEYDDAIQQRKKIRSHGAYLFGVLKRYLSVHERAGGSMGQELTPQVQRRLDQLVTDGFCTQDEMNEKVKSKIRMLSEKDAIFAIEEFSGVDRGSIRNVGSYFMGILNRYMRGERMSKNEGGGRQEPRSQHDGRSHDRGRTHDRDFHRDKGYGQDRDSYRRERSRDDPYRNHNDRSNFAPRQQSHYGQQPQPPPPPPPPPPRPQYGQQQQPPNPYQQHPPNAYQQQPQQNFVPNQQQPQQNFVPNQGFPQGIPGSSQPPMRQPPFNQQPPHMGQMQGNPHMPPMQAPGPMPPGAPMAQQQQHGMINRPGMPVQNQTMQPWQQPQQQQHGGQADILGIAAKAAQALATSQNVLQRPGMQPPGMPGMPQPGMPQHGMQHHGMPQVAMPQHGMQQQQQLGMSRPGMQQQQQPPQQYPGQPPAFNPPFQPQQSQQQQFQPPRRGRTVAKMHELPIAVQFAVQNLQTIGHISGPLDEGILGMVKDLPEPMALAAINRFVSLDTSSMRNTTAYFAGLLRRELEKIKRR